MMQSADEIAMLAHADYGFYSDRIAPVIVITANTIRAGSYDQAVEFRRWKRIAGAACEKYAPKFMATDEILEAVAAGFMEIYSEQIDFEAKNARTIRRIVKAK
jgi:hypothetical protein